ncbi:MAG: carbohydrate kinase, partial [Caldilineaceae bacterium]|nr:carbohydrate kinase [Caldilineaceae bacterium]
MTTHFLGVDIGTYSSKGVLVREDGAVVASHVVPHELSMPRPGWYEHDAEGTWWHDFVTITRALLAEGGVAGEEIAGVGISSISPAIVPLDGDGRALRPAILYGIDTRATREIREIEQALGGPEAVFERYAVALSSQAAAPKIRWLRNHEPEVWQATRLILSGTGYIVWRLTGAATIDHYDVGAYVPLYDPATLDWDPAYADLIAPLAWMAQPTWTCAVAGRINAEGAAATGLAAGTRVITGTADAAAEAISAGLAAVGDMMIMYGSSIFFIVRTDHFPRSARFWGARFLERDTYALAGG